MVRLQLSYPHIPLPTAILQCGGQRRVSGGQARPQLGDNLVQSVAVEHRIVGPAPYRLRTTGAGTELPGVPGEVMEQAQLRRWQMQGPTIYREGQLGGMKLQARHGSHYPGKGPDVFFADKRRDLQMGEIRACLGDADSSAQARNTFFRSCFPASGGHDSPHCCG